MVSDKPPRRSKREKEPVTIDLTPEETSPVAEPTRSIDADEPLTAAEQGGDETEKPAPDTATAEPIADPVTEETVEPIEGAAASQDDTVVASPADEPPAEEALGEHPPLDEPPVDQPPVDEPKADETAAATEPEEPAKPATWTSEPAPTAPAKHKTSPATSTLIASGIFGGIVALLLAGSMQYAGYIPGASRATPVDTSGLSAEIDALRQEVAALKDRPAPEPAQAAAADPQLEQRLAALEANAGNESGGNEEVVNALRQELAQLKSQVEASQGNAAELQQRVDAAEAKLNDPGPEQQAARAVAAAALKAAIDRGGSFEAELQTYANVAGDDAAVADLRDFATSGVPSRDDLQREFSAAADAMLEASAQPDPDQGVASRLFSSAMSVVKVRRVGDVEGDTPDAAVARMEDAVRKGDLQAAAREWDKLPEPAKAASQEYKKKLDARLQVETLVDGALTRAVAETKG
ncbi:hypothetical protein M0654_15060 [Rhizobium sp. NTR19]|uniref:YbgF trimerisation domain-containing protein n=1 Tax=Neorhizobium turbinariae TaxID=2937795 RepID=A0ABT0ITU4_9HYPH|nr:hypothetical protein [Neorhizobium turbinariae]MCK8781301.1 hypothetical protein [Neorhizobium turbinariae]